MAKRGRKPTKARDERRRFLLSSLVQALIGSIILSLMVYIVIGNPELTSMIETIQSEAMELRVMFIFFPIALVVIFLASVAQGVVNKTFTFK